MFTRVTVVTQEDVPTLPAPRAEDLHIGVVTRDAVQTPLRSSRVDEVVTILRSIGAIDILAVLALKNTPSKNGFAVL